MFQSADSIKLTSTNQMQPGNRRQFSFQQIPPTVTVVQYYFFDFRIDVFIALNIINVNQLLFVIVIKILIIIYRKRRMTYLSSNFQQRRMKSRARAFYTLKAMFRPPVFFENLIGGHLLPGIFCCDVI